MMKILVITGPTASGKTALSIALAKKYNGEIVNADSMQIYKELDIGTAKPTLAEMDGVVHHLLDFLAPTETFSVAEYVRLAKEKIADIHARGHLPIIAGGTGLYITSLLNNIAFEQTKADTSFRNEMRLLAQEKGNEFLLEKLRVVDEKAASELHPNNLNRIIRALEIHQQTGKNKSLFDENSRKDEPLYEPCIIALGYENRAKLYDRINLRVDMMLEQGLLQEAERFLNMTDASTSAQAIGYKELAPFIKGEKSYEDCVAMLKQKTRNYAKRQLTWIRGQIDDVNWIMIKDEDTFDDVYQQAIEIVDNKLISQA